MSKPSIPESNDSRPAIRSLEELMAAPAAPDPAALLAERGAMVRQLGRRLSMPLADLLREGGA